jgi:predicted amidohydrolase
MRLIKAAAVEMDANPGEVGERLNRAASLVESATQAGASLVVLPEFFHSGYAYDERNFRLAEDIDGQAQTWMREAAARLNIHLAGSILLREEGEIYNAMLLYAPDGQRWRYDKQYPWGWERGYYRGGKGITVAHTALGDIGMMVCWDTAHLDLWRGYAGKIDLLILASCPPDVSNPVYIMPDGTRVSLGQMGPIPASVQGTAGRLFGEMVNEQAAWLGVPVISACACGQIQTLIPNSHGFLVSMLPMAPRLAKYLADADPIQLCCDLVPGCKVVDGGGEILARTELGQGEGFAMAEVTLADHKPSPNGSQPATMLPRLVYFLGDIWLPWLSKPTYRKRASQPRETHPTE